MQSDVPVSLRLGAERTSQVCRGEKYQRRRQIPSYCPPPRLRCGRTREPDLAWVTAVVRLPVRVAGHSGRRQRADSRPQAAGGVREQSYIRRPLDLLRVHHIRIEAWLLKQACVEFKAPTKQGLQAVV